MASIDRYLVVGFTRNLQPNAGDLAVQNATNMEIEKSSQFLVEIMQ